MDWVYGQRRGVAAQVAGGLKDRADVVRSSLEAFVVKLVPIEQVSPSRTGPGRLAYIQAAPDYGVGMESW